MKLVYRYRVKSLVGHTVAWGDARRRARSLVLIWPAPKRVMLAIAKQAGWARIGGVAGSHCAAEASAV